MPSEGGSSNCHNIAIYRMASLKVWIFDSFFSAGTIYAGKQPLKCSNAVLILRILFRSRALAVCRCLLRPVSLGFLRRFLFLLSFALSSASSSKLEVLFSSVLSTAIPLILLVPYQNIFLKARMAQHEKYLFRTRMVVWLSTRYSKARKHQFP